MLCQTTSYGGTAMKQRRYVIICDVEANDSRDLPSPAALHTYLMWLAAEDRRTRHTAYHLDGLTVFDAEDELSNGKVWSELDHGYTTKSAKSVQIGRDT